MIRYTCPSPDRWTAMLREDLSDGEQHDLEAHLDECPDCQRVLETCAADRSAWAAVPRWLATSAESDAPLKTVIERLKNSPDDEAEATDMTLDFLDPSEQPGSLGRVNGYEIMEEIGRGGMGVVLKALDPALHRVVAIKVLAPPLAISASYRKRFTREARAAAAVCHEHVVTIHAVEEFKSLPYLVMQYVAGQSLQQKLDSCGPLPVADVLRIGTQAAAGLAAAHAQGLVHRDIKPGNILLENGVERVRITDFGLARTIDDVGVTSSGVITGTPQYMAPEQARGQIVDARADLFSLGSVLYAMCTGETPFHGSHALDVLLKVAEDQPQPIRELNYAIPPWLVAIVTKLMAKDPAERYQSASEVAELLERCLAHVQSPNTVSLPATINRFAASRRSAISRWAALVLPILAGLFVVSEGTGATHIVKSLGTILRFRTPEGTLIVEVDDPAVKVTLDEKDLVITGAGAQEVRLKVGSHTVRATKDGHTKSEIVSIEKDGKATVKVSFEADGLQRPTVDPNAKPAQPPFVKDQPRFTLQFHNEPWTGVFEGLTKLTGFPVIAKLKPTGTFTFLSPKTEGGLLRQYNLPEVIDIVNEGLMQQHFLLVRRRDRFVVIPTDEKIDLSYFEHVPSYELEQRGKTELVNYIVRLELVRGADARAELQKLLSPIGMAQTIPGGGLSISDKAENVRRILQVLTDLDRRGSVAPNRFGGDMPGGVRPPPAPGKSDERKFVVEMPDEPWSRVFEWFAENTKMPVIDNYKPGGTFTLASPYECTLSVFFDHMNSSLMQQKFLLVRRDKDFLVIRTDEKIDPALFEQTTIDELPRRCRSDLVSIVYRLGKMKSADAVLAIKKMQSAVGSTVAEPVTNALLISDMAENVRSIVRVLGEMGNRLPGGNAKSETSDQPTPGGNKPSSGPPKDPDSNDPRFSSSFPREPWPDFFDRLSKLSGLPVVAPIKPEGDFFGIAPPPLKTGRPLEYTLDELLDTVNSLLSRERFFLARRPDKIELFPTDTRLDPAKFTSVSMEELATRRKTDLVAVDYQLKYTIAAYAAEFLKPFHGPLGSSSATNRTNRVLIRDTAERVQSIVRVLNELERKVSAGGINRNSEAAIPGDQTATPRFQFPVAGSGEKAGVYYLAISPDGLRVFTSNSDGTTKIWRSSDGRLEATLQGQSRGRCPMAISKDGDQIAVGGRDRTINLWDARSGKLLHTLRGHDEYVTALEFAPDGLTLVSGASGFDDKNGELRVWDTTNGKELQKMATAGKVKGLTFGRQTPECLWVLMGNGRTTAFHLTHYEIGGEMGVLEHTGTDRVIAVDPKVGFLAVGYGAEGRVSIWDSKKARTGHYPRIADWLAHDKPIMAIAFSRGRNLMATASEDGTAKLWDTVNEPKLLATFETKPRQPVSAVVFSPDGNQIVTAGEDGLVRFWDIRDYGELPGSQSGPGKSLPSGPKTARADFGVLAANTPIALVVTEEGIEIRDVAADQSRAKARVRVLTSDRDASDAAPKVAISADGRRIAVGHANVLTIYDGETGKKIKDLNAHEGDIAAVTFGANGKLLATSGKTDGRVRIWDVSSLSELRQFHDFPTPATVLAFSPDGTKFLANNGSVIQTLSISTGEEIDYRIPIGAEVSAAAFNSQGHVIALVGPTILTWKPEKGAKVRQIDTTINLTAMALTPDGQRVLVGGRNGELALFRLMDGQLIRPMSVPGPVQSLSIAPDGQSYSVITETRDGRQLIGSSAAMLSDSITPPPVNGR